jgi:protein phosphatase
MRIGRASWVTDTGRKRLRNEDAHVFEPPLFAIADGMGGARAGEVAAGIAAAALREGGAAVEDEAGLEALIDEANRRVWERSIADPQTAGMGTTVTIAVVDAPAERVLFGHVGDSRAYRLREGALEQITTDHSLVAELVESGVLTPEEAARHPQRSAITRAVGTERAIDADVFPVPALPGDLFLLCSDGLTDMLFEEEIASCIVDADGDPEAAARALVASANAHGGEDNITVVLFELVEGVDGEDGRPAEPAVKSAAPLPVETAATSADTGEAAEVHDEDDGGADVSDPSLRRHGAGPGGRVAALLLILGVLLVAALAVYWSLKR